MENTYTEKRKELENEIKELKVKLQKKSKLLKHYIEAEKHINNLIKKRK